MSLLCGHVGVVSSLSIVEGGSRFRLPEVDLLDSSGPVLEESDMTCLLEAKKMQPLLLVRWAWRVL